MMVAAVISGIVAIMSVPVGMMVMVIMIMIIVVPVRRIGRGRA
jgi:hypothetical protein